MKDPLTLGTGEHAHLDGSLVEIWFGLCLAFGPSGEKCGAYWSAREWGCCAFGEMSGDRG